MFFTCITGVGEIVMDIPTMTIFSLVVALVDPHHEFILSSSSINVSPPWLYPI